MRRHSEKTVKRARELAINNNLNYCEIAEMLNVDNCLISRWCRDLPHSQIRKILSANSGKRNKIKATDGYVIKNIKMERDVCKLYSGIIYGCEGSKYPSSNCVAFINSDPNLVLTFLSLFKRGFKIDESKLKALLQVHSRQNYDKLKKYWSKKLKIPEKNFHKPSIRKTRGGKHRNNYKGTCTVKYYDYTLQLRLIGIFEAFMRKLCRMESGPDGKAQVC